jgi:hypothetical protein
VWDEARQSDSVSPRESQKALQADVAAGRAVMLQLGGDCGGSVALYIDELPTGQELAGFRPCGVERRLELPSGRLLVGGAEDYRSATPIITDTSKVVTMAPGTYAVACHANQAEVAGIDLSRRSLEPLLGKGDHAYYRRISNLSLAGYLLGFAFIPLRAAWGWKIALALTVALLVTYFWIQEQWLLPRNARYQNILARINAYAKDAESETAPVLILTLRLIDAASPLRGGAIEVEEPPPAAEAPSTKIQASRNH